VVLAGDLPFVTLDAVETLAEAAPAVAIDDRGASQFLLAAYLMDELRQAIPARPDGTSLRSVVEAMGRPLQLSLDGSPPPWWDCDTPKQLAQARSWA
jgi:molybdopterin-guanine dinucleotide biosynthesis protein A